jgi:hypothetical protein
MLKLIRDGGAPVLFVIAFGLVALVSAARFAIGGKPRPLGFLYGMMATTAFAILSGICADFGTTFFAVVSPEGVAMGPQRYDMLIEGVGESMSAGILGFSLLALSALLIAVGKHRADRSGARA